MSTQSRPLSRAFLKQELGRVHFELSKLRRAAGNPTEHPDLAPDVSRQGEPTLADFFALLDPIRQELKDLSQALNHQRHPPTWRKPRYQRRLKFQTTPASDTIQLDTAIKNRTVTLRNLGATTIDNPRLTANGRGNWYSVDTILDQILRPRMTQREKALAIWRFLVRNRYHDEPGHPTIELHDPTRFLNCYGYGHCNDAAVNFAVLAQQAGLRARVWGLSGHVVPEAFFDRRWHMLDPDAEIYYLADDGKTISSVRTLEQRPDIIRRGGQAAYLGAVETVVEMYQTTNRIIPWYLEISEAKHTMAYRLRPGEELMRSSSNWGLYFSSLYLDEPSHYGNGRWTFAPIFARELFREGATSVRGLRTANRQGKSILVPKRNDRSGELVYEFASPYPYLAGSVTLRGVGAVELSFSASGTNWRTLWTSSKTFNATHPLDGCLRTGCRAPLYRFFLKVKAAPRAAIAQLRFVADVQVAPLSLPALKKGPNKIHYEDDSPARSAEVIFGFDPA